MNGLIFHKSAEQDLQTYQCFVVGVIVTHFSCIDVDVFQNFHLSPWTFLFEHQWSFGIVLWELQSLASRPQGNRRLRNGRVFD